MFLLNENLDDFYQFENMDEEEKISFTNYIFKEIEKYANGGMEYIKEKKNNEPEFFSNPYWPKKLLEECTTN